MSLQFVQNRVPIRIFGKDAQKMLDAILSAKIEQINDKPVYWALLSPQGKIQAQGLAIFFDNAFYLDVHISIKDAFLKRLKLYKMRSDVEITDLSDTHKIGFSKNKPNLKISFKDPREENLGYQSIAPIKETSNWQNDNDYSSIHIKAGIAELGEDFEPNEYFPHDIGMDLLNGVDFKKGCYIGQEIVSRTQHKGKIRRRPVIVSNINGQKGDPLEIDKKQIGVLGQVINNQAIGFVRLDKISNLTDINVNDKPVQLALPDWANYHL